MSRLARLLVASSPQVRGEMPVLAHLQELRSRLMKATLALAVGTVVGYAVFPHVLGLLIAPYCSTLVETVTDDGRAGCTLVALKPLEPFSVRLKTAVAIGAFVGGPAILVQLWRFVTPGLTGRERRYTLPFVVLSQVMFACGLAFAYVVIPQGLRILLNLGGPSIEAMLSASEYLSFLLLMAVAFGLVFELPLVLILLTLAGVITSEGLRGFRSYAFLLMVVAAAIITPTTDAFTLFLMVGPMALFYELSIQVARLIERRRRRQAESL